MGISKLDGMCFCPSCNYVISKLERDSVKFDMVCPNCQLGQLFSSFYSVGSKIHKAILSREFYQTGRPLISPPKLPTNEE